MAVTRWNKKILSLINFLSTAIGWTSFQRTQRLLKAAKSIGGFGTWSLDIDKGITYGSEGLHSLMQLLSRQGPLSQSSLISQLCPEHKASASSAFENAKRGLIRSFDFKSRFVFSNEKVMHVKFSGRLIGSLTSKPESVLVVIQDISDLVIDDVMSREAELKDVRLQSVKAIIGTYKHQINNPLAIALGALEAVKDPTGPSELEVASAVNALWRIADVLKQLDFIYDSEDLELTSYLGRSDKIVKFDSDKA